jgi:hypothetical protein
MSEITRGRVVAAVSTYRGFLNGRPFQWAVNGLPDGEVAFIAMSNGTWQWYHRRHGSSWMGRYPSANAALRGLARWLSIHQPGQ